MKTTLSGRSRQALQIVLSAGVALGAVQTASAATDNFLRIGTPPIRGESADDKHKDEIDVLQFSETMVGKNCSRFSIVKYLDKATPHLAEAIAKATVFSDVRLVSRKAGERPLEYYTVTMQAVTFLSSEISGSGTDDRLTEKIVLSPKTVIMRYVPQAPDGSGGAAVETTLTCP